MLVTFPTYYSSLPFFFSYSNYTQNDIALLFKLLLLKKERPPLPKNPAKAFI